MEAMKLDLKEALDELQGTRRKIDLNRFEEVACSETESSFRGKGFAKLAHHGEYLYTTCSSKPEDEFQEYKPPHIGQMRICFQHDECGLATVMG